MAGRHRSGQKASDGQKLGFVNPDARDRACAARCFTSQGTQPERLALENGLIAEDCRRTVARWNGRTFDKWLAVLPVPVRCGAADSRNCSGICADLLDQPG